MSRFMMKEDPFAFGAKVSARNKDAPVADLSFIERSPNVDSDEFKANREEYY